MSKMRNVHFITYGHGSDKYETAKQRIVKEAAASGYFDTITPYSYDDLSVDFKKKYKDILNLPRGGGYWIWKVDIIKQKLSEIDYGEYVVYLDCGCSINNAGSQRFFEYLDMLHNSDYGIIDFEMQEPSNILKKQCTKQVFDYFNIDVDSDMAKRGGCVPGVFIIKKNKHTEMILNEFVKLLDTDPYLITDKYNEIGQHEGYWQHRHDQSIFTCLFIKYGSLRIKRNESWSFGEFQGDDDPDGGRFGNPKSLKYPFWATRLVY
jgi:hypothetical protein